MGWQHGRQVYDLRPRILAAVEHRISELQRVDMDLGPFVDELRTAWEVTACPIMAMMRGIADALELEWEQFFRYTVSTYLMDKARQPSDSSQGCTVWAAEALVDPPVVFLVKNRDYWSDHQDLQCFARAHPQAGYRYAYLTRAGSPGVFSSGMNEVGLAVADTHVVSLDIGPGLPRYAVMMEILEHHKRVESALEYILSVPHTGNGTIVLADAEGDTAIVEAGYSFKNILHPQNGFVISANHFVSPGLNDLWIERRRRKALHGNSLARYAHVKRKLRTAHGAFDHEWAKGLMSDHTGILSSICRHPEDNPRYVTISSIIFLPQSRQIHLAAGMPCQTPYELFSVTPDT